MMMSMTWVRSACPLCHVAAHVEQAVTGRSIGKGTYLAGFSALHHSRPAQLIRRLTIAPRVVPTLPSSACSPPILVRRGQLRSSPLAVSCSLGVLHAVDGMSLTSIDAPITGLPRFRAWGWAMARANALGVHRNGDLSATKALVPDPNAPITPARDQHHACRTAARWVWQTLYRRGAARGTCGRGRLGTKCRGYHRSRHGRRLCIGLCLLSTSLARAAADRHRTSRCK